MQLELPIRWTETDKEATKNEELIGGEVTETMVKYTYGKLLIKSKDIGPYYDMDKDHTMINDKFGKIYCVTIPIDQFKKILTEVTGNAIMTIQVRENSPTTKSQIKPPPKYKSDDDDILI